VAFIPTSDEKSGLDRIDNNPLIKRSVVISSESRCLLPCTQELEELKSVALWEIVHEKDQVLILKQVKSEHAIDEK